MDKKVLVVATSNQGKIREIKELLKDLPIEVKTLKDFPPLPPPEEKGKTFFENAFEKAMYYAKHIGEVCLADDSGLVVDALGGEPGVYSARYAGPDADDEKNNQKLLEKMKDIPFEKRDARFVCVIVVCAPDGRYIKSEGIWEGKIAFEPRGTHGFGYDPLFLVKEYNYEKTSAELEPEEKNRLSHRGKALKAIKKLIPEFLGINV
ncbi:MAG: XTP/dITP diphosphatase [Thermodesulfobacteria bacterium]|nr:XTP/dITP diphosphatase [Thermodesulfobacteriota bacterium]